MKLLWKRRDVIIKLDESPSKKFSNGWNTIESSDDSYEVKITDKEGNSVTVLLSSYKEVKE